MKIIKIEQYEADIKKAIRKFWNTRGIQLKSSTNAGTRGAVTGGKQLDGFLELITKVCLDTGVPPECIYVKGNHLPGYFRATKAWDFIIVSPNGKLIVAIELKSQVGSFGNNFNNRTEEALGSAVDIGTAIRENAFENQAPPWLGYMIVVEQSKISLRNVKVTKGHFATLPEFENTNYLARYEILCRKLMLERHYDATCLLRTTKAKTYANNANSDLSLSNFLSTLSGHIIGRKNDFNK